MDMRFSGKLVLIASGTGGLGRAVSLAFLEQGAKLVVTYQEQKEFDDLKRAAGPNAASLQGRRVDVTDEAVVDQFIQIVLAEFGRLDVVVNAVGGYAGGVKLWDMDSKLFERMLSLNARSGYSIAHAVVAGNAQAEIRSDHKHCSKGCVRPCRRRCCLRGLEGGGRSYDGFTCRRSKGYWSTGEFDSAEHHRHGSKPQSDARR
jgi:NAD(P)-dependent dehydrogenase (short-subunit alcohol dehydrogenase family)